MRGLPLLLLVAACAPKMDKGPIPAERWKAAVRVVELPVEGPNIYLQAIVAAGSSNWYTGAVTRRSRS